MATDRRRARGGAADGSGPAAGQSAKLHCIGPGAGRARRLQGRKALRHQRGDLCSLGGSAYDRVGIASWYGTDFHARQTANGELFDMNRLTAAHPTLPLPSLVQVTNLRNGRSMIVRVNDRGPYKPGRIIDLSRRTAQLFGFDGQGTTEIRVRFAGRRRSIPPTTGASGSIWQRSRGTRWRGPAGGSGSDFCSAATATHGSGAGGRRGALRFSCCSIPGCYPETRSIENLRGNAMIQHDVSLALAAMPVSLDPKYSVVTKQALRATAGGRAGGRDGDARRRLRGA